LREGVFRLDKIQRDLRIARDDLNNVTEQKRQIEETLTQARQEQSKVQSQLNETRQALQTVLQRLKDANQKQSLTATALKETQTNLSQVSNNYTAAQSSLKTVTQKAAGLNTEISQLQKQRQALTQQRDAVKKQIALRDQEILRRDQNIAKLDASISERDRTLSDREKQLQALETQREQLTGEVETLNQNFQNSRRLFQELRRGNVALLRNQVLYKGVLTGLNAENAPIATDQLLQVANKAALQLVRPGTQAPVEQVIVITKNDVNRIVDQIKDGRPYVVRVFSAGNYLVGERDGVVVFVDVSLNQLVFQAGEQIATTVVDSSVLSDPEIIQRLEQLLAASQFRAQRNGVLSDDVEINIRELTNFVEKVKSQKAQLDIRAITAEGTYTAGPLRLQLIAARDGQILFRSNESSTNQALN
jgi:uncharacterized protein (DUF3084 family)